MTSRPTAAERVAALIDQTRDTAHAARKLAVALDMPGLPERFAEQAADAAAHLERLVAKLDTYFYRKG